MNEPISWDPTLVKKFSSSNHYKLLNQLRNEVKKYPLNNKKNVSSNVSKDNNLEKKNKLNVSTTQSEVHNKDTITNNSTVSFNNAKNFSIYNNINNKSNNHKNDTLLIDQNKTNEDDT
tara:strand:+ start:273 stop:626 length:354 start_codon:yes stop_codon:yes gene_type:complete